MKGAMRVLLGEPCGGVGEGLGVWTRSFWGWGLGFGKGPKKHTSISIVWGYPYLIGLLYKGGLYGISLS